MHTPYNAVYKDRRSRSDIKVRRNCCGGVQSLSNLVGDKEFVAVLQEWEEEVK